MIIPKIKSIRCFFIRQLKITCLLDTAYILQSIKPYKIYVILYTIRQKKSIILQPDNAFLFKPVKYCQPHITTIHL